MSRVNRNPPPTYPKPAPPPNPPAAPFINYIGEPDMSTKAIPKGDYYLISERYDTEVIIGPKSTIEAVLEEYDDGYADEVGVDDLLLVVSIPGKFTSGKTSFTPE